MKKIHEMTVEELRDELERTEKCLQYVFEEAKLYPDPSLSDAYYEFQNEADRIRNRLWEIKEIEL